MQLGIVQKAKKRKTFYEIISTVSDEKMMVNYEQRANFFTPDSKISAAQQRFYLAWYAKAAYEHVGFQSFSKDNKRGFRSCIEDMYNKIENGQYVQLEDFLRKMGESAQYIEDRHFEIQVTKNERIHGSYPSQPKPKVGSNFMFGEYIPVGYERLHRAEDTFQRKDGTKEIHPVWEMGTFKKNGKNVLLIAIYDMSCRGNNEADWKDFIDELNKVYPQYKDNEGSRIILDVRGNLGGEDKPIDYVAKLLYGNLLNTFKRGEIKDTPLSNFFLHKHGAYKPANYTRDGLKEEDLIKRSNFSGENKILFDETKKVYPFNQKDGYKGKTDILIDTMVASSAESAYTSFYFLPRVRYVGQNTHGMQQYTQGTFIAPWGGQMRVGVVKLTYWDKEGENIEVKGHKPDVDCTGSNALRTALSLGRDEYRAVEARETNENHMKTDEFKTNNEIVENPQNYTDPRKAYYARTLDPALREIEQTNILTAIKEYNNFLKAHSQDFQNLAKAYKNIQQKNTSGLSVLETTDELPDYNLGTNQRASSNKAIIANATEFKASFDRYKEQDANMSDTEAKARVVFDALDKRSKYTYDEDAKKTIFTAENGKPVSREEFYAFIFDQALSNTNFFAQNMDIAVITLEKKALNALPKNTLNPIAEGFKAIPPKERHMIMYKKGFYHEMIHTVLGTNDERKCDAYAMLRIMREHPEHAKTIFEIYNLQRSKIGHVVSEMHGMDAEKWKNDVARGTMTYLMPKTYEKMKWFATHPKCVPNTDEQLLELVHNITQQPDFTYPDLASFHQLIDQKNKMTVAQFKTALAENPVVKICAEQSGESDVNAYLENDQELHTYLLRKQQKQRVPSSVKTAE